MILTAHEEPKHNELAHARRNGSGNREDDEQKIATMV
jgi:hypothetical protein